MRKLIAAIACVALAPAASAEIAQTAPGRYDCQAPAGQGESRDVSSFFPSSNFMAARFRFLGANDPADNAVAGMQFRLDNGQVAQFLVVAPPTDPDIMWVGLMAVGSHDLYIMKTVRRGTVVELSATMARGAIFARSGNERGQINVADRGLTGREIVCSAGRFEIELTRNPRPPRPY